jgi:hypothetical protein
VLLRILGKLVLVLCFITRTRVLRWLLWLCRYNMSYVVQQSALNGKPVLGVSINYRLAAFGFLDSEEVRVCEIE